MNVASQLGRGFISPFVGASLLAEHGDFRRLAFLPFLLTVVILILGLGLGLPFITSAVPPFTHWLLAILGLTLSTRTGEIFSILVPILIWPALALALIFVLLTLTRFVASPLYGLLAERVLMRQGILTEQKVHTTSWLQKQARITRAALIKAVLFLFVGLVLGLLSFLPGLALFTSFAFLVLLAYDVIDYSLEAMTWNYEQRLDFFRVNFFIFLGLGSALGFLFLVPGLNFFALPAAVAGAADLVRRIVHD